jgi:hypothetical protein
MAFIKTRFLWPWSDLSVCARSPGEFQWWCCAVRLSHQVSPRTAAVAVADGPWLEACVKAMSQWLFALGWPPWGAKMPSQSHHNSWPRVQLQTYTSKGMTHWRRKWTKCKSEKHHADSLGCTRADLEPIKSSLTSFKQKLKWWRRQCWKWFLPNSG